MGRNRWSRELIAERIAQAYTNGVRISTDELKHYDPKLVSAIFSRNNGGKGDFRYFDSLNEAINEASIFLERMGDVDGSQKIRDYISWSRDKIVEELLKTLSRTGNLKRKNILDDNPQLYAAIYRRGRNKEMIYFDSLTEAREVVILRLLERGEINMAKEVRTLNIRALELRLGKGYFKKHPYTLFLMLPSIPERRILKRKKSELEERAVA